MLFKCSSMSLDINRESKPTPFTPNYLRDTFVHFVFVFVFFSFIVFLTLGIIAIGPANILCIVSNFIYSFYTFVILFHFST